MLGIPMEVIEHKLGIDPSFMLIKQKERRYTPERCETIYQEVNKLLEVRFIRPVDYPSVTSPRLNRINSILIPLSCNFFSGSPSAKNSRVKRAWPGAISGWVTDREVFPGVQSEDKSAQKRLGLVYRARL
jgi:hypothetical protein